MNRSCESIFITQVSRTSDGPWHKIKSCETGEMTSSDSLKENQRHNGNGLARSQEILSHAVFMMSGAICSALFSPTIEFAVVYYLILVYGEARNDAALKELSKKYSRIDRWRFNILHLFQSIWWPFICQQNYILYELVCALFAGFTFFLIAFVYNNFPLVYVH